MYDHDSAGEKAASATVSAARSVRIGVLSGISKLDPRDAVDNISGLVLSQIFEAPYAIAAGETAVRPVLFEPLRHDRGLQYSAAVRPGICFSDGTPLTADIAARSLRGSKVLQSKATIDEHDDRVVFTLTEANPRFDLTLTQGNTAIVLDKALKLCGTGAFMFEQRPNIRLLQGAKSIRLVRNPHYHGQASVDELQFVVLPADAQGNPMLLVDALQKGEVDITTALSMADLKTYSLSGLTPSMQPGNSTGILYFNTERRVLADAQVRRGIATALDVHEIATRSFDKNPAAFVAPSLLPPMMGRANGIPEFDRAEAKRLLDASGAKPSRLSLLVPWAPRPYMPKPLLVAQSIQSQLAEVGIRIELRETKTSDQFFDDLMRGNYDLALGGWIADTPDPADFFEALLWSKNCEGENHSNDSRWKNETMDAALHRFRATPSEENKREIHRLIAEHRPLVPLIYGQSVVVHSRKVRNVTITATGEMSLAGSLLLPGRDRAAV
jgi:ABC-type transport system substrate-binding protein